MSYTIRNIQPSVLFVPDAGLRLEFGQTAVVHTLTSQMQSLLTLNALEVVSHEGPSSAPVVTPPAPDGPPPPAAEVVVLAPTEQPPEDTPADTSAAMPPVEEKRSGRKAAAHAVTVEGRDDAQ